MLKKCAIKESAANHLESISKCVLAKLQAGLEDRLENLSESDDNELLTIEKIRRNLSKRLSRESPMYRLLQAARSEDYSEMKAQVKLLLLDTEDFEKDRADDSLSSDPSAPSTSKFTGRFKKSSTVDAAEIALSLMEAEAEKFDAQQPNEYEEAAKDFSEILIRAG